MSSFSSVDIRARARIARWALVAAFTLLGGAFFKAQVLRSSEYLSTSESNRVRPIPLPAPRGELRDRNGLLIAENTPGHSIRVWANNVDTLRAVVARMDSLASSETADVEDVVRRWRQAPYQPVQVFSSGEFELVSVLEEHRSQIPGLVIQVEPRRYYPDSTALGHLVGYVGDISRKELDNNTFTGARMGTIVGKSGLELEYDADLRGVPGVRYVEVTAQGRTVQEGAVGITIRPRPGKSLTTTLDLPLQQFIDSMWRNTPFLAERKGALLAMRPTGEILAYYSHPAIDPNKFVGGISMADYAAYRDDPQQPLLDRVIQGSYPPASPFKLAVAAIGLKRSVVTIASHMPAACTGGYQFGGRRFRCWKPEGHGSLDLAGAIAQSCDVYFYQLGLKVGAKDLLADGASMGFDDRTGIDLEREVSSRWAHSIDDYEKVKRFGVFTPGQVLNLSIGQGANDQTLVNMVTFYAALASDGVKRAPFLIRRRDGAPTHDLGLTPRQLAELRNALVDVVQHGTAGASGGRDLDVAGKTGTGQMPRGQGDAGWFIGFAPATDPQIVIGIVVEAGQHGSTVAKYVVQAIRRFLIGPDSAAIAAPVVLPVTEDLERESHDDSVSVDSTDSDSTPPAMPAPTPARRP